MTTQLEMLAGAGIGGILLALRPWPSHDPLLVLIAFHRPGLAAALRCGYITLAFSTPYLLVRVGQSLLSFATVATIGRRGAVSLPPYPHPLRRESLFVIVGERASRHGATGRAPVVAPSWLAIPERGLYTGIAVVGAIGSGKTSCCMYPFADQILGFRAEDPSARIGGLVLEVKGDFCHQVRKILDAHGRGEDYLEIGLDGAWRYNPLQSDLDAYALAYGIASLLNNVFGRGKEPFWQQAYTNLVKFIILLHKVLDDYVTFFDIYECAINSELLQQKIEEGARRFGAEEVVVVDLETYVAHEGLWAFKFDREEHSRHLDAPASPTLLKHLAAHTVKHELRNRPRDGNLSADRRQQFEAVKRWFYYDWRRIEPKLRTSIVEGIAVFLSLFDDSPALKRVFCPPKACYDTSVNGDGHLGVPLPPFAELIEQGRVCALNFPVSANPGLARTIGTLMKLDFQRAVLNRIPAMEREPSRAWRGVLFLCDEYHVFATVGEQDPMGDEKFFGLSRQARCVPIVATQSLSSLRSALPGESWRTLLQTFRTRIFLALSDDFSARVASDLCGKSERLTPYYHLAESGQDAHISVLTGRATAHRASISASKTYHLQRDFVFEPKVFAELKNAQAIVLLYDGFNPWPPTVCYLKPAYLDRDVPYLEQVARGWL